MPNLFDFYWLNTVINVEQNLGKNDFTVEWNFDGNRQNCVNLCPRKIEYTSICLHWFCFINNENMEEVAKSWFTYRKLSIYYKPVDFYSCDVFRGSMALSTKAKLLAQTLESLSKSNQWRCITTCSKTFQQSDSYR